jgi:hypothetical protein
LYGSLGTVGIWEQANTVLREKSANASLSLGVPLRRRELRLPRACSGCQFVLLLQLICEENDSPIRPAKTCFVRAVAKPEPGAQIRFRRYDIIFFFDGPVFAESRITMARNLRLIRSASLLKA